MLIITKRGNGDRPYPQDIVNPLCCTTSVAIKKGTAILDEQEVSDSVSITLPYTGPVPDTGSMVQVLTAENTIESMRLSGWKINVQATDRSVEPLLELSLQKRNPL